MSIDWKVLSNGIDECMLVQRSGLRRRIKQLSRVGTSASPKAIERLVRDIEQSRERRNRRGQARPCVHFPQDLPISRRREDIARIIKEAQVTIVCGETGSGKTTQLPKICLSLSRGVSGFIGHTQPRRIAARSVAARLAAELNDDRYVGYKVRFGDTVSPETYIKVMTDGILLAELAKDRWLEQYDTLIVDEAHERSLNIDFLLGYLKRVLKKRPELKLIITSATIDATNFSAHFDTAPVIEVSGRGYPITLDYQPLEVNDDEELDLISSVCDTIESLVGGERGDILVFFPGEREIHETAVSLPERIKQNLDILPLYSRLERTTQERVFATSTRQKVILATNVAETSITVPNIGYVIDTGQARISRYSHRNKIQRLPVETISQASAAQRMGRCGRTGPGRCIRLYEQLEYDQWPEFTEPEIRRTNLAAVILRMKSLSLGDIERFPFIDAPDRRFVKDGLRLLHELGALDQADQLTETGRQLARFPIDPRIARMIVAAGSQNALAEILVITSALSIQEPFEKPRERRDAATRAREPFTDRRSDFLGYLNFWRHVRDQARGASRNTIRRLCAKHFVSWHRFREWEDVHRQLKEIAREQGIPLNAQAADYGQIHRSILAGSLGLIGHWREGNSYDGARASQFQLSPASTLYKRKPTWMMAAELVETSRIYAHRGARIRPEWVEAVAPAYLLSRGYAQPKYDVRKGRVFARERVFLYGLPVIAGRRCAYDEVDPEECRKLFIASALVEGNLRTQGRFLTHNQSVVHRLRTMEHKTRRTEVLEDDATIADLYDARIPGGISRAATFERWRRSIEREQPLRLHFDEINLRRADAPELEEQEFPDFLIVAGHRFPLTYRFDPSAPDDGITVRIPVLLVNQIPEGAFEWLVPGRLLEKILSLLRALPKGLRRHFVPLPEFARRCHLVLKTRDIDAEEQSLSDALACHLTQTTKIRIPADSWNIGKLAPYLLMNFEVIDAQQRIVGKGRNLGVLRRRFSAHATGGFEQLTPTALRRDGLKRWPDIALPVVYRFTDGEFELCGFPAIVDQGDAVGVRLLDTLSHARQEGDAGLRRLMYLYLATEFNHLRRQLFDIERLKLLYVSVSAPFAVHCFSTRGHFAGSLDEEIMRIAIDHCFVPTPDKIRDLRSFENWLQDGCSQMAAFLDQVCRQLGVILEAHHHLRIRLSELPYLGLEDNLKDIAKHLDTLLFRGFLSIISPDRLTRYPRYLAAVGRRVDRLISASRKDLRRSNNLNRLWDKCQNALSGLPIERREEKDVQSIRWMLEELRVATFAQGLGTEQTISIERVEAALAEIAPPAGARRPMSSSVLVFR